MNRQHWRVLWIGILSVVLLLCLNACECDHDYGKWKVVEEATCTEAGEKERECDACGETETKKIPPTGHSYTQKVTAEPSCRGDGETTYTCKHCKDSYTEPIPVKTYSSTEIYDMHLNSVGEVVVYDKQGYELGLGSCFVYQEDGTLITNYHVIEGAYSAEVTFGENTYDVEEVLAYDKTIDIAILKIAETGMKPVTLCDGDHSVGETVYAFGSSRGLTATFSDGMITYSNRELDGVAYVQHDVPISGGNSGGPLINIYGEVIGINTWSVVDSQNLNFAIHLSELENLDYSNAMTLAQVYAEENDPFKLVKDYAMTYGEYEDGEYILPLGNDYSADYTEQYTWWVTYEPEEEELRLCLTINMDETVGVLIDSSLDGVYDWVYADDYGYQMYGTLYGRSFDDSTELSYSYTNISSSEDKTYICTLSSLMIDLLLSVADSDLGEIGVAVSDFGFINY